MLLGELGDYDPKIHEGNYISEHKLLLKQTEAIEEQAMKLHQSELKGLNPEQAETRFLWLASQLDTYAVDPHPVKVSLESNFLYFHLCSTFLVSLFTDFHPYNKAYIGASETVDLSSA